MAPGNTSHVADQQEQASQHCWVRLHPMGKDRRCIGDLDIGSFSSTSRQLTYRPDHWLPPGPETDPVMRISLGSRATWCINHRRGSQRLEHPCVDEATSDGSHWFCCPLICSLAMARKPTCLIGIQARLVRPSWESQLRVSQASLLGACPTGWWG